MKPLLWVFLALLAAAGLNAQTPDCVVSFNFAAVGQRSSITGCAHNTQGVYEWRVIYLSTGFTGPFSLRLESSPDGVTWSAFAGTLNTGINPNTATTDASTDMSGYNPYVSVVLNAAAGTGKVAGTLYGCRQPGCAGSAGAGGSVVIPNPLPVDGPTAAGSAPTSPPVLVAGQDGAPGSIRTFKTDAAGQAIPANASSADADAVANTEAAPTGAAGGILYPRVFGRVYNGATWDRQRGNTSGTAPTNASSADADAVSNTQLAPTDASSTLLYARIFGRVYNGTTWDRQRGNTSGTAPTNASAANADGVNNTSLFPTDAATNPLFMRVMPDVFNGATWDRDFNCPNQAAITITAGTDVVIVPGVASTITRICHVSLSWGTTPADVTFRQGTGTTCGTNQAALSGAYAQLDTMALDFGAIAAMRTTVAARDLCLHFSTTVTGGGFVSYAQF